MCIVHQLPVFSVTNAADSTKHDGLQVKKRGVGESPNVFVNQKLWLPGGEIWFMVNGERCTVSNNLLRLVNTVGDKGSDVLGKFVTTTETYRSYSGPMFQAIVKTYQNIPVILVGQVCTESHACYINFMGERDKNCKNLAIEYLVA